MTKLQFRVLYREFLFRLVDLEVLAPQADIVKLLGKFATILICLSFLDALGAVFFDSSAISPQTLAVLMVAKQHALIAKTMLTVGLFAVLSWDSTFPNRRDVLVLAPLPVRPRTLFLAKVAALATALSVAVVTLNLCTGLVWPIMSLPPQAGFFGLMRSFAAYWIAMLAAGAFIFCSVLAVQGLAAQLPRRHFLRVSAFLQLAALCLCLCVYFLEPSFLEPSTVAGGQRLIGRLPSFWFLGLFRHLNGSGDALFASLALRAGAGLGIAVVGAAGVYLLSYFRTLRKIVEEPDLAPSGHRLGWTPRFGGLFETAIVLFSARTLLRSRQHRVVLAFYLGIGFAMLIVLIQTPAARRALAAGVVNLPWLMGSFIVMIAAVVGTRAVFAVPLDLHANWIFRIMIVPKPPECLRASRRALLTIAVAPVWIGSAAIFLASWPWRAAVGHLMVLALVGIALADLCLRDFYKIPFTCSYLPGRSPKVLTLTLMWTISLFSIPGASMEMRALDDPAAYARMLAIVIAGVVIVRWRVTASAKSPEAAVRFDEMETPYILGVGLSRDGRVSTGM